jgi:ArsR family transcriptional regulator, arsenate/arsenite/antimonite-responsive transcriptional repressor
MTSNEREVPFSSRSMQTSPSLVCDLCWTISDFGVPTKAERHPILSAIVADREDLTERVQTFWADEQTEACFTEMLVLAHHAGALTESSPALLFSAIGKAVRTVPTDLELASETPEDRVIFLSRLRRLKESPELLGSYLELLAEVWEPVDAYWQASQARIADSGIRALAQIERSGTISQELAGTCQTLSARLPFVNDRVSAGHPLLVVPCLFFGNSLYLEFPGLILIGTGVEHLDLAARARTEPLARRLKTVADPTRLALLHYLATEPSTVSQLATSFGLAQPTVSMHVKVLRETGLVQSVRQGGRLQLSAKPDAVDSLVEELRTVVQGARSTGNLRIPATVVDATRSGAPVTS